MAIGTDQPTLTAETQQTQIHHDSNNALSSGSRHSIAGNNTSTFRTNYTPNREGGKGVYKPNPTSNSSSGYYAGSITNVHGSSRSSISEKYEEQENNLTHSLTHDQYNQLLNLLGNIHVHGEATNDGHRDSVDNLANGHGAVNLAGPFSEEASGDW
uniref:Uncharacterized protein n=1 Tax=Solanum tuberosum TaxID=4113 RepID=M1A287_SOLTU